MFKGQVHINRHALLKKVICMAGTLRSWRRNEAGAWPSPGWPGLLSWEKGAEPHVPESFEVELPEYERGRFSDAGKYSGGFVAILIRAGKERR